MSSLSLKALGTLILAGVPSVCAAANAVPQPALPPTPPEIRIVEPVDGAVLPVQTLAIFPEIFDLDGYVYRVDYFAGTNRIASVQREPFTMVWRNPLPGRYVLTALAIDNSGRRRLSEPVRVQIGPDLPDRIVRGPYLQRATPSSMVIRWRTDWFTRGMVRFGVQSNDLQQVASHSMRLIDHEIPIKPLLPGTVYYYEVGTPTQVLATGSGLNFKTPPSNEASNTNVSTRIWVIGDSGTADDNARHVYESYQLLTGTQRTDVWLMLGDNAYECGTDDQYQAAVFDIYPDLLSRTALWPAIGNHDLGLSAPESLPYFDIFTLPNDGQAGGLATGTERFYSFDHANIHFICLDSQTSDRSPSGQMLTWLENDLAATTNDWIIAYWHHPPYARGTHNSDVSKQLIDMRENALPILERHGVDLVLAGHSHAYERSVLLDGHHGFSTNLTASMILDASSGRSWEDQSYHKPAGGLGANRGCVYVVCGCSGEGGNFTFTPHPAMYYSSSGFGSVVLDVKGARLDARFITDQLELKDGFTILKDDASVRPNLTIQRMHDPARLRLSWPTSQPGYSLESLENLPPGQTGEPVTNTVLTSGRERSVILPPSPVPHWYRLRRQESDR